MEAKISVEDQKWINEAKTEDSKNARKVAILNIMEVNGLRFDAGIGKSYIPEKNFFQIVNDRSVSDNVNRLATSAMNWHALGRGIGGLAGAGVRNGVIELVNSQRECIVHNVITDEIEAIAIEYTAFIQGKKDIFPFWAAQSMNVLGLAAAIFNREMHHWNAENTKPQSALIAALNQQDSIPESEFRKLFYLSIHPIPLAELEKLRASIAAGKTAGINDSVTARCRSAPAGTGDVHACAQAISDLKTEAFYSAFGNSLKQEVDVIEVLNVDLVSDAGKYHAFAANYGKTRTLIERSRFKRAMICLCAYVMVHVKGSLAQSAALKKFRNSNARMVQKWIAAFETASSAEAPTLADLAKD
jgi:hypothetical protein